MTLAAALASSGIAALDGLPLGAEPVELTRAPQETLRDAPVVEVEVAHPRCPGGGVSLPPSVLYLPDTPQARDPRALRVGLALDPVTWTRGENGWEAVACAFRVRHLPAGIGAASMRAATPWLGVPAYGRPPGIPAKRPDRVRVHIPGVGYVDARLSLQGSDDEPVYAISPADAARLRR